MDGKPDLYRLVLSETLSSNWDDIQRESEAAQPGPTFKAQLSAFVNAVGRVVDPDRNRFLASVGVEAQRHPEFEDLGKERDRVRDPVFASLLETALGGGSLSGGDASRDLMIIRIIIMGWALEKVFSPEVGPQLDAALIDLAEVLDRGKRPAGVDPEPSNGSDSKARPRGSTAGGPPRARRQR